MGGTNDIKLVGVKDLVGAKKYHDAFCVQPMLEVCCHMGSRVLDVAGVHIMKHACLTPQTLWDKE